MREGKERKGNTEGRKETGRGGRGGAGAGNKEYHARRKEGRKRGRTEGRKGGRAERRKGGRDMRNVWFLMVYLLSRVLERAFQRGSIA